MKAPESSPSSHNRLPASTPGSIAPSGRSTLDQELGRVRDEVLVLDSMVEHAIVRSIVALRAGDVREARAIDAADELVNGRRYQIEEDVIALLATQQPVAGDLRRLTAFLFTATDLERIGDYVAEIARAVIAIDGQPLIKPLIDIPHMTDAVVRMLRRALDALASQDANEAGAAAHVDDEVRALYQATSGRSRGAFLEDLFRALHELMHNVGGGLHLSYGVHARAGIE
jgi:phosphate transport system protein